MFFETQPSIEKINTILAVMSSRKVDAGHSIKYKNKLYKTITGIGNEIYFKKGTSALVIESFDKKLYANVLDQLYILEAIPTHEHISESFDVPTIKPPRKYYIPPMSHPMKHASYLAYQERQKHLNNSGANV